MCIRDRLLVLDRLLYFVGSIGVFFEVSSTEYFCFPLAKEFKDINVNSIIKHCNIFDSILRNLILYNLMKIVDGI